MSNLRKSVIDYKNAPRECQNCLHGVRMPGDEKIFCKKTGIRLPGSSCKKFCYDPLKRTPKRPPKIEQFSPEDFEL